ncbi:hypothetical protein ABVK25_001204 [Lepraria finkii]|uniref:Uncharacterized protein n=1 Tax=Lepraria finkii TaxID=1340010 RepID=A0ABR4BN67_9LECA
MSKLRRASLILSAHTSIVRSAIKRSNETSGLSNPERSFLHPTQSEIQDELRQHLEVIKNQKRKLAMLSESTESTGRILLKMLNYRNDEVVHENVFSLKDFASIASGESKSMLYVTQHARNYSRMMNAASLIAPVNLPASLIATIFGSDLVQISPESASFRSKLRRGIGLFVGLTLFLTVAAAYTWERRGKTSFRAGTPE